VSDEDDRLREILAREASKITTAPDGLTRIRARLGASDRGRAWARPLQIAAAAVATVAVIAGGVGIAQSNHTHPATRTLIPGTVVPASSSSTATSPVSSPPTTSTATLTSPTRQLKTAKIFYASARSNPKQVLYSEISTLPAVSSSAEYITDVVRLMLLRPPTDSDYTSHWPAGTTVEGTEIVGDTAQIDLSAAAGAGPAAYAQISAQQLAYTIETADPTITAVTLTIGNGPVLSSLWGAPIGNPITTGDSAVVLAPVWITSPTQGVTVDGGALTFGGEATAPEGTVNWEILSSTGAKILAGYTTASVGAPMRGNWTASATLPTGSYTVEAFIDPQNGGAPTYVDRKTFSVDLGSVPPPASS
jgi:hypothetical protein